eukprot:361603_1
MTQISRRRKHILWLLAIFFMIYVCILYHVQQLDESISLPAIESAKCIERDKLSSICFIIECAIDAKHKSHIQHTMTQYSSSVPLPKAWKENRISSKPLYPYNHLFHRSNNLKTNMLNSVKDSRCYISHKYKFVFVHVKKSGGTSMIGFLTKALCKSTKRNDCQQNVFRKINCNQIVEMQRNYFYFSIVRNPYDRMFSLFAHVFILTIERNYTAKATVQNFSRIEILKEFSSFVYDRRYFGLIHPANASFKKMIIPTDHYYPQNWYLFNIEYECPVVDFIGHIEHIKKDMKYLINLLHNKLISNYYQKEMHSKYWKVNVFGSSLKAILFDSDGFNDGLYINSLTDIYEWTFMLTKINVKQFVYELYQVDFTLFGYNPKFVEHNLMVRH